MTFSPVTSILAPLPSTKATSKGCHEKLKPTTASKPSPPATGCLPPAHKLAKQPSFLRVLVRDGRGSVKDDHCLTVLQQHTPRRRPRAPELNREVGQAGGKPEHAGASSSSQRSPGSRPASLSPPLGPTPQADKGTCRKWKRCCAAPLPARISSEMPPRAGKDTRLEGCPRRAQGPRRTARYPAVTAIVAYEVTGTWRRTSKDLDYVSIDPTSWAVEGSVSRARRLPLGGN